MNAETQAQVTWTIGTIIGVCTLLGLGVRWVLVPYLREHLIKPLQQVEKQVTENHHSNPKPTLLDRFDDVEKALLTVVADIGSLKDSRDDETERLARGDERMERIETMVGEVSASWLGWRDTHEVDTQEKMDRIRRLERIERDRRRLE